MPWKKIEEIPTLPEAWRFWLANKGSMTEALEKASGSLCSVSIVKEGWGKPWKEERDKINSLLILKNTEVETDYWIREVVLSTHFPLIFARSIFPASLLKHFPELMHLQTQPLGRLLFSNNRFERGLIEAKNIKKSDRLFNQIPVSLSDQAVWARRSLFHASIGAFLLTEVFFSDVTTL